MMRELLTLSKLLIVGVLIDMSTGVALAQAPACVADLARVNTDFCLTKEHASGLSYSWTMSGSSYNLKAQSCVAMDGGSDQDVVIAVDRSQAISQCDSGGGKLQTKEMAAAHAVMEELHKRSGDAGFVPRVALVIYSSDDRCKEFQSGDPIDGQGAFPCLFVPARPITDTQHRQKLRELMVRSERVYSRDGFAQGADYEIVADLLEGDQLELEEDRPAGLLMLSNAMPYQGQQNDPYTYLRSESYLRAEKSALNRFATPELKRYRMVFGLIPHEAPFYQGRGQISAFETMCASDPSRPECQTSVEVSNPQTWPVNQIAPRDFAQRLVQANGGGAADVIDLGASEPSLAFEKIRQSRGNPLPVGAARLTLKDGTEYVAKIDQSHLTIEGLAGPIDASTPTTLEGDLYVESNGEAATIPLTMTVQQSEVAGPMEDQEMLCEGDAVATEGPDFDVTNLQGGSASCGVIPGAQSNPWILFVLGLPVLFLVGASLRRLVKFLGIGGLILLGVDLTSSNVLAQGLNVQQHRPVVDGVGMTEKASTMRSGQYGLGLFTDYADDPVELGDKSHKRVGPVVDSMWTMHGVAKYGIYRHWSVGLHIPMVAQNNMERLVDGEVVDRGKASVGDGTLWTKYHLVRSRSMNFGFMPMITLPMGDEEQLVGDGGVNAGLMLLFSGLSGRWEWAYNFGYLHRQEKLKLRDDRANETIDLAGQVVNAGGIKYRMLPRWALEGTLQSKFTTTSSLGFTTSNPAEWIANVRYVTRQSMDLYFGFGSGLGKGIGSPDYRVIAGVSYMPRTRMGRGYARR